MPPLLWSAMHTPSPPSELITDGAVNTLQEPCLSQPTTFVEVIHSVSLDDNEKAETQKFLVIITV